MARSRVIETLTGLLVVSGFAIGFAAESGDLAILTYPVGLVTGPHAVDVDLGAGGGPATLYLDGQQVCAVSAGSTQCEVDFGEAPHVHLLELVRTDSSGDAIGHAARWVNRPGQEAELVIQLVPRKANGVCGGKALWSHPSKRDPVLLEVTENGQLLRIREDGRSFAYPCPDADEPHVLAASAIFPDGRRAEAVALSGSFGGVTEAGLSAVALTAGGSGEDPCALVTAELGENVSIFDNAGFEVVFVLDPTAGYRTLLATGWSKGMMPTTTSTTKQFDSLVQQGSKGSEAKAKNSWKRAESSLIDAEKMWLVLSNENLQRANGFSQGKMNWLLLLFNYGSAKIEGNPRIADAVATSGLVAAAGPRRRAVVVILGNHPEKDGSGFTAEQAQDYLAEVGVPLFVLRTGKLRDDGWPQGIPVKSMEAVADAFEAVRADINQQCVAWFPGDLHLREIKASLPAGVALSGRTGQQVQDVGSTWRRAELDSSGGGTAEDDAAQASGVPVAGSRIEVTAVTVLLSARDAAGRPIDDLDGSEVEVSEDGRPVRVLGLQPVATATPSAAKAATAEPAHEAESGPVARPREPAVPMPVAIYVDRNLAAATELTTALEALAERSAWLASLGPVDIVVADGDVTTPLAESTSAEAVEEALASLASSSSGQHAIASIRSRFVRDIRKTPNRFNLHKDDDDAGESAVELLAQGQEVTQFERSQVLTAARGSVFEEDAVLRQSMTRVADWALANPGDGPRLLLVVGAGFDIDPVDFYLPFVERIETHSTASAREEFKRYRQADRVDQTGRDLAAAGWLVIPVATQTLGASATGAEYGGGDRFQQFLSTQQDAIRTSDSAYLMLDPIGAQRHLAAPSGGEVAMGAEGLDGLMDASAGWYRLTYQIDRPPDGANHQLAVSTDRDGVEIRSTSVIASETAEGAASARVRRLLHGSQENADLAVAVETAASRPAAGKMVTAEATVTVDLSPIAALMSEGGTRNVRLSIGILPDGQDPYVMHRVETVDGVVESWRYRVPLEWPQGKATVAVVVEDLGSGSVGRRSHRASIGKGAPCRGARLSMAPSNSVVSWSLQTLHHWMGLTWAVRIHHRTFFHRSITCSRLKLAAFWRGGKSLEGCQALPDVGLGRHKHDRCDRPTSRVGSKLFVKGAFERVAAKVRRAWEPAAARSGSIQTSECRGRSARRK